MEKKMKENKTNNSESTNSKENLYRHDVDKLKRGGIHQQKEEKQSNLYLSTELVEEEENLSSSSDRSSLSSSFDVSPEKSELRHRSGGNRNNLNKADDTSKANKNQTDTKQINLIWVIVIVIVMLILGFLLWSYLYKPAENTINIENLMTSIKDKYNTQSNLTYRVMEIAIVRALSENSMSPGILILLASEEAKHVSKGLALHIANAVSKPYVDIKYDSVKSPEELKKDIDDAIQRNLNNNERKAVLVEDLDHLPFEAAMIFHSYCDHENAPFKKALYVMTMQSEEKLSRSSNSTMLDILATKRLNSVWKKSGYDQVSSLISRLTVSVAGVTP